MRFRILFNRIPYDTTEYPDRASWHPSTSCTATSVSDRIIVELELVCEVPLIKHATFGAGCFWGVEEIFRKLPGIAATRVGYMGGTTDDPTYDDVCTDTTGHVEVVEVSYDPSRISYDDLLDVFWQLHDPTSRRSGPIRTGQPISWGRLFPRCQPRSRGTCVKGGAGTQRGLSRADRHRDTARHEVLACGGPSSTLHPKGRYASLQRIQSSGYVSCRGQS